MSTAAALLALQPDPLAAEAGLRRDMRFTMRVLALYAGGVALVFAVHPTLLRPLFPAATALVGFLLYQRNQSYFLSFLLWIYTLTPLLRRLVDWRDIYQEQSFILVAPLLLSLLPLFDIRRRLALAAPVLRRGAALALTAILFGAGIGFIKHPGTNVVLAMATWMAPISLGLFAGTVRDQGRLAQVMWRTFVWAAILLSLYAILQFVVAPAWDIYWLKEVSEDAIAPSFGKPRPFEVRVWSTMNSPGAFAAFLSALILWSIAAKKVSSLVAQVLGYIALLLTLVRGFWLQTAIGVVLLLLVSRRGTRARTIGSILLLLIALGIAQKTVPHADIITRRMQTLNSLHGDESYRERQEMYRYLEGVILSSPLGQGLDTTGEVHGFPLDSSVLTVLYLLGWAGAALYLGGLIWILLSIGADLLRKHGPGTEATFQQASGVIALAASTQMFAGDILYRQGGVMLWLAIGLWASFRRKTLPVTPTLTPTGSTTAPWSPSNQPLTTSP